MNYLKTKEWKLIKRTYNSDQEVNHCWICGSKNNINLHHLSYKRTKLYDFTNVVALCAKHHKLLHFFTGTFSKYRTFEHLKFLKENLAKIENNKIDSKINRQIRIIMGQDKVHAIEDSRPKRRTMFR